MVTIVLSITPVNYVPVAVNGTAVLAEEVRSPARSWRPDADSSLATLTYTIVSNGARGVATINAATGAGTAWPTRARAGPTRSSSGRNATAPSIRSTLGPSPSPSRPSTLRRWQHRAARRPRPCVSTRPVTTCWDDQLLPVMSFTMMGWFKVASDSHACNDVPGLSDPTSSNAYLLMTCCGNGSPQLSVWSGHPAPSGTTWCSTSSAPPGADRGAAALEQVEQIPERHTGPYARWQPGCHQRTLLESATTAMSSGSTAVGRGQALRHRVLTPAEIANESVVTPGAHGRPQRLVSPAERRGGHDGRERERPTLTLAGVHSRHESTLRPARRSVLTAVTTLRIPRSTRHAAGVRTQRRPLTFPMVTTRHEGLGHNHKFFDRRVYRTLISQCEHGTDSFTFKANDGSLDSNVATVTIRSRRSTTRRWPSMERR